jgi:hypothetical protein
MTSWKQTGGAGGGVTLCRGGALALRETEWRRRRMWASGAVAAGVSRKETYACIQRGLLMQHPKAERVSVLACESDRVLSQVA